MIQQSMLEKGFHTLDFHRSCQMGVAAAVTPSGRRVESPPLDGLCCEEGGVLSINRTLISFCPALFLFKVLQFIGAFQLYSRHIWVTRALTAGGRVGLLTFTHPDRGFRSFTQGLFSVQVIFIDLLKTMAFSSG